MILFIVEGSKTEPRVYETIKKLYFKDEEDIICIFRSNIYGLYNRLKKYNSDFEDLDNVANIVDVIREMDPKNAEELKDIKLSSDIDQVFLFFDYDFQHAFHVQEQHPECSLEDILKEDNARLKELLDFFNEETEMGKLYINYPMIESLKYTKQLPDDDFITYKTTLEECHGQFKKAAEEFSDYKDYKGILWDKAPVDIEELRRNWELLKQQNVMKANYICSRAYSMPVSKEDVSQQQVFMHQINLYDDSKLIAILNSFPLFLYDYLK